MYLIHQQFPVLTVKLLNRAIKRCQWCRKYMYYRFVLWPNVMKVNKLNISCNNVPYDPRSQLISNCNCWKHMQIRYQQLLCSYRIWKLNIVLIRNCKILNKNNDFVLIWLVDENQRVESQLFIYNTLFPGQYRPLNCGRWGIIHNFPVNAANLISWAKKYLVVEIN